LLVLGIASCSVPPADEKAQDEVRCPDTGPPAGTYCVLLFTKTAAFRHDSIATAVAAIRRLEADGGFVADATQDATRFSASGLERYRVVAFLMTTGDVLNDQQQGAFEVFMRGGRGYVGIHSAADTEYTWPWYGGLAGAWYESHPPLIQDATVRVEVADHPATSGLPASWSRRDEWYNFRMNPRTQVTVLANLDESTYDGGMMNGDHPIAWYHEYDGGRAFYTGMGHTLESYTEPAFTQHLLGGIRWAAGAAP
jgi:type 1 glutamine amidotransferase